MKSSVWGGSMHPCPVVSASVLPHPPHPHFTAFNPFPSIPHWGRGAGWGRVRPCLHEEPRQTVFLAGGEPVAGGREEICSRLPPTFASVAPSEDAAAADGLTHPQPPRGSAHTPPPRPVSTANSVCFGGGKRENRVLWVYSSCRRVGGAGDSQTPPSALEGEMGATGCQMSWERI